MTQPTPAGWYPNPSGPGQRYWDGQQWTDHYHQDQPAAPAATPDPAPPTQPSTPPPGAPPPPQWNPTPSPQTPQPWAASPAPSTPSTATTTPFQIGHWVVMGAAALLLVACILPWATVSGFGGTESDNAFESGLPWLLTGLDIDSGDEGSFAHGFLFALAAIAAAAVAAVPATRSNKILPATIGGVTFALILANVIAFFNDFSDLEDMFGLDISVGVGAYTALVAAAGIVAGALIPATKYGGKKAPSAATPPPGPPY